MTIHIGTSGWVYNHWRGTYYAQNLPRRAWFAYYAADFDTVEINNSFYRLPSEATFDAWHEQAPPGFLYAVKASRFITHTKKLKDPEEPLRTFFERTGHLGETLGPVLYQLPPINIPHRITASPVYIRFHGDVTHGGDYSHAALEAWAKRIADWRNQKLDVFVYFNNDVGGYALKNAKTLKQLLSHPKVR